MREVTSGAELFHVSRDASAPAPRLADLDDTARFIRYDFGAEFLALNTIGTSLVFRVGDAPVQNFRMIERHYFRGKLIKSFDFNFPFCIPNSTNEWEFIYEMPKLSKADGLI